jgi:hypothetical protein
VGAKIRDKHAREEASKAAREADRAEAYGWSVQIEGYGGPAQPSPTLGQCIHGRLGWLEAECNRCKTRASLPLDAIRRPWDTPIWKFAAHLILETGAPPSCAAAARSATSQRWC